MSTADNPFGLSRFTSTMPAVTGVDGKTYTRTEAPSKRRAKFPDSYRDAAYRIGRTSVACRPSTAMTGGHGPSPRAT